jgi:hypothetical protein
LKKISNCLLALCFSLLCINAHSDNIPEVSQISGNTKSVRSVKEWTKCNGVDDDSAGLAQAVLAARGGAFTLNVDCPIYFHVGMDIAKPIFIDNKTTIKFSGNGVIIVDNVLVPAFVIANSSNINLLNWKIKYTGSMVVDENTGGYYDNSKWIPVTYRAPAAQMFYITLSNWLRQNRNINYARGVNTISTGFLDPSAIFFIKGDTSNVVIKNMQLFAAANAKPDKFIPIAFSLNPGEANNQSFTAPAIFKKPILNVPHNIVFDGIKLDGYYFGWHGSGQNITIKNVTAERYSDLQDSNGKNIGGVGFWFPPPHLFYFNTPPTWDVSLLNNNFLINNIKDNGVRKGLARDKGKGAPISGHAVSLKIQANNSLVESYISLRPDGFMDVLSSTNLTVRNVTASYDSSFINYTLPMLRFTQKGNHNITFENIALRDNALMTNMHPVRGSDDESNTNIRFIKTRVQLNNWSEDKSPMYSPTVKGTVPYFGGKGNFFDIKASYVGMFKDPSGLSVFDPESVNYGNNSLRNIPVGSFGLRTYLIHNTGAITLYDLVFPAESNLPSGMSYDETRSTCSVTGNMSLLKGEACKLVFRYNSTLYGVNANYVLKILAKNKQNKLVKSRDVYIPYSSR